MRELCRQHKKDYYDRLTYIAADRSERMLHDVLRHGVLGGHPGRYRVRQVDAMEPEGRAGSGCEVGAGRTRASGCGRCFSTTCSIACRPRCCELDGDAVRQLCVRTCVARNVRLADYTDLTAEQLRQRARTLGGATLGVGRLS